MPRGKRKEYTPYEILDGVVAATAGPRGGSSDSTSPHPPKKQRKTSKSPDTVSEDDERRKRRLIANRRSAQRNRVKRLEEVGVLESLVEELVKEVDDLRSEVTEWTNRHARLMHEFQDLSQQLEARPELQALAAGSGGMAVGRMPGSSPSASHSQHLYGPRDGAASASPVFTPGLPQATAVDGPLAMRRMPPGAAPQPHVPLPVQPYPQPHPYPHAGHTPSHLHSGNHPTSSTASRGRAGPGAMRPAPQADSPNALMEMPPGSFLHHPSPLHPHHHPSPPQQHPSPQQQLSGHHTNHSGMQQQYSGHQQHSGMQQHSAIVQQRSGSQQQQHSGTQQQSPVHRASPSQQHRGSPLSMQQPHTAPMQQQQQQHQQQQPQQQHDLSPFRNHSPGQLPSPMQQQPQMAPSPAPHSNGQPPHQLQQHQQHQQQRQSSSPLGLQNDRGSGSSGAVHQAGGYSPGQPHAQEAATYSGPGLGGGAAHWHPGGPSPASASPPFASTTTTTTNSGEGRNSMEAHAPPGPAAVPYRANSSYRQPGPGLASSSYGQPPAHHPRERPPLAPTATGSSSGPDSNGRIQPSPSYPPGHQPPPLPPPPPQQQQHGPRPQPSHQPQGTAPHHRSHPSPHAHAAVAMLDPHHTNTPSPPWVAATRPRPCLTQHPNTTVPSAMPAAPSVTANAIPATVNGAAAETHGSPHQHQPQMAPSAPNSTTAPAAGGPPYMAPGPVATTHMGRADAPASAPPARPKADEAAGAAGASEYDSNRLLSQGAVPPRVGPAGQAQAGDGPLPSTNSAGSTCRGDPAGCDSVRSLAPVYVDQPPGATEQQQAHQQVPVHGVSSSCGLTDAADLGGYNEDDPLQLDSWDLL